MINHSFNVELAERIGLKEAIILQHIYFWYQRNKANNKNFHDETWWSFNKIETFVVIFPYIGIKSIRNTLKNLEDKEIIKTGCYNKVKFDRTKWYSITNKGFDLLESPFAQKDNSDLPKRINENFPKGQDNTSSNTVIINSNIKRFKKPTVEEVEVYCRDRRNNVDWDKFVNYYDSKGWVVGKSPMKDWKASVRTWESNKNNKTQQRKPSTTNYREKHYGS